MNTLSFLGRPLQAPTPEQLALMQRMRLQAMLATPEVQSQRQQLIGGPMMGPPISMQNPGFSPSGFLTPLAEQASAGRQQASPSAAPQAKKPSPTTPMQAPMSMMPQTGQGLLPDQRAIIDALTGKRVHKDMSGKQIGLQGVSPALKHLLYSMRGRRHLDTAGRDVY